MILDMDKDAVLAPKGTAYDADNDGIKLMIDPYSPGAGTGKPILVMVKVSDLTPDTNARILIMGDDTVAGPFVDQDMSISVGPKALAQGWVTFGLPTSIANAIKIALENFTGGTYEAYAGVQTH